MSNFVVYTVLTGNTENELNNPLPPDSSGFDRICFTDDISIDPNGWKLVYLDSHYLDAPRASRYPKILPHRYLPEYEWSLYIDNTVRLKRSPLEFFLKYVNDEKTNYWCVPHPWRDCIYDEAEEIIRLGYDDERRVREQMDHYYKLGYPEKSGLVANTVLLRKHNTPGIIGFNEIWFQHVLRFSRRDQLSFPFLAKTLKLDYHLLDLNLQDNEYWTWPGFSTKRLPRDFNEDVYDWLNPQVSASGQPAAKYYMNEGAAKSLPYSTRRWELTRLANKYRTDKGNYYYNGHNYATVYEQYFQPIRELPLRILELGLLRHDVQARNPAGPYSQAPSLQMWREYFPNAEIIGFDIQDFSAVPPTPNVHIVRGDMGNVSDLLALAEKGNFDIIIDDASHASHHQQIALSVLFLFLNEGGYYIIEDLDYQPPQWERSDAVKTKHLLKLLKMGVLSKSPYMPYRKSVDIYANGFISFYDSFDVNFNRTSDSLVVIQKRYGSGSIFGKYRLGRGLRLVLYLIRSQMNKIFIY